MPLTVLAILVACSSLVFSSAAEGETVGCDGTQCTSDRAGSQPLAREAAEILSRCHAACLEDVSS